MRVSIEQAELLPMHEKMRPIKAAIHFKWPKLSSAHVRRFVAKYVNRSYNVFYSDFIHLCKTFGIIKYDPNFCAVNDCVQWLFERNYFIVDANGYIRKGYVKHAPRFYTRIIDNPQVKRSLLSILSKKEYESICYRIWGNEERVLTKFVQDAYHGRNFMKHESVPISTDLRTKRQKTKNRYENVSKARKWDKIYKLNHIHDFDMAFKYHNQRTSYLKRQRKTKKDLKCWVFSYPDFVNVTSKWSEVPKDIAVISICDPDEPCHLFKDAKNVINLDFYDITGFELPGGRIKGMSVEQSRQLSMFIYDNLGKNFYIHCMAGLSRSQGVAKFITSAFPDYYPQSSLRKENPCLTPNWHVVDLLKSNL